MEVLHAHLCHEHRVSAAIMKIEPNPRLASYLQQVSLDRAATKIDSGRAAATDKKKNTLLQRQTQSVHCLTPSKIS